MANQRDSETVIHGILDAHATRFPDKAAFRYFDQSLTYAGLASRAFRLAGVLHELGVRQGDRVAIFLEKSLESAVAVYGIMAAGAAYVPIDPGAPAQRVNSILKTCGARIAVTHESKRRDAETALVNAGLDAVVGLDAPIDGVPASASWSDVESMDEDRFTASAADLAYIIFTSGSTGVPKGIMHTHASGLAYARMAKSLYALDERDCLSNASPLHFDMSTFDYFSGPQAAATTIIIPEPVLKLPASLAEMIEQERITVWYSVPFPLIKMLQSGVFDDRDLSSLRLVMFGGEPFVPKYLEALMRRLPQAGFANVYGPAEVNQCCHYTVPKDWRAEEGHPPIGHMCAGNDYRIHDEENRPVDTGEAGELLVATPTMMRGYWDAPELTEKGFYRSPEGAVFYRTGDLVKQLANGDLEFIGRKDRQIKTRGYRVELDEVEAALARHPAVQEAAAFPVRIDDETTLVEAAAVLKQAQDAAEAEIISFASDSLPRYALPVALSIKPVFPRTSSGKIDRKKLAAERQHEIGEQQLEQ